METAHSSGRCRMEPNFLPCLGRDTHLTTQHSCLKLDGSSISTCPGPGFNVEREQGLQGEISSSMRSDDLTGKTQTSFQAHRPFLRPPLGRKNLASCRTETTTATEREESSTLLEPQTTTDLPLLAQQDGEEDHNTPS